VRLVSRIRMVWLQVISKDDISSHGCQIWYPTIPGMHLPLNVYENITMVEAPLMYMENMVHPVCVLITVVTDRHTKHICNSQTQALWRLPQ